MNKLRGPLNRFTAPHIVQPVLRSKVQPLNLSNTRMDEETVIQSLDLEATDGNQIIKIHQPIKTPRSEMSDTKPLLHSVSSTSFDLDAIPIFDVNPLLMETSPEELPELFRTKCEQCEQMCDFSNKAQIEVKQAKQDILNDMLNAVTDPKIIALFGEEEYRVFYKFFQKNIMRVVPRHPRLWFAAASIDFFSLDRVEEAGWAHMSLVYDIFYTFLNNRKFNAGFCKRDVFRIIRGMIPMFQSPDAREREKLMKMFHGVYRNFQKFRSEIRKIAGTFLSRGMNIGAPPTGYSECLTALIPVIQGFKTPLHEENIEFFSKVLLPMHGSAHIGFFHSALVQTVYAFLTKCPALVVSVLEYMKKHWPVTFPSKQILFLSEIETISDAVTVEHEAHCVKIISRIVRGAVADADFAVAEKALMLWESDSFMRLIESESKIAFPELLPQIFKSATTHWCSDVKGLALNAMRVLKGCDVETFDEVGTTFKKGESDRLVAEVERGNLWGRLADLYSDDRTTIKNRIADLYVGCDGLRETESKETEIPMHGPTSMSMKTLKTTSSMAMKRMFGGASQKLTRASLQIAKSPPHAGIGPAARLRKLK